MGRGNVCWFYVGVLVGLLSCIMLASCANIFCNSAPAWNNNPQAVSGTATWFDAYAQGGGACGWTKNTNDLWVAAWSAPTTQDMCVECGNCFNVIGPTGSAVVRVIDYCDTTAGNCTTGSWTLDKNPYTVIAGSLGTGSVSVTYYPVPCNFTNNLEYTLQSGVGPYWISINVANEIYPLQSVEITHDGNWTLLPRASYNYWWYNPTGTPQDFPATIRVTDTKGDTLTDTLTSLNFTTFFGNSNFFSSASTTTGSTTGSTTGATTTGSATGASTTGSATGATTTGATTTGSASASAGLPSSSSRIQSFLDFFF